MKFKIVLMERTVIYANDICIFAEGGRKVTIWADLHMIDSIDLGLVHSIWVLDRVRDICIYI